MLATPIETVARTPDGRDIERIAAITDEYEAVGVVVGLPTTLRGEHGAAAQAATAFADRLAARVAPVEVIFHDERLTTAAATQMLRAGGRSAKQQRSVIDQAAAVAILQSWLDLQKTRAARPTDSDYFAPSDDALPDAAPTDAAVEGERR